MQTAKGTLKLGRFGDIHVSGVTPAEAVVLNTMFKPKDGGLVDMEYTGETQEDPMPLLQTKYSKGAFSKAFPGEAPKLPQTFAQVKIVVKGVPSVEKQKG